MAGVKNNTTSFRIDEDTLELIHPRDTESLGAATLRFVAFAESTLKAGRTELCGVFTLREWRAIADVLNGTFIEPSMVPHVATEILDADEDGELSHEWQVDGASIVHRVRSLSPAGKWALCDAIARLKIDVRNASLAHLGIFVSEGV